LGCLSEERTCIREESPTAHGGRRHTRD